MFMQRGKAKTNITNNGPEDTDAAMFFRMMKNCKLFEIENENHLYDDVLLCRDKLHHSANNRVQRAEAKSHLDKMTALLEKFENVPNCVEARRNIEKMRQETILSISVPDFNIRKMAQEVLKLKKKALEVDKETNKDKGFSEDDINILLEETNTELKSMEDPEKPLNESKTKEDYERESEENMKKIKELQQQLLDQIVKDVSETDPIFREKAEELTRQETIGKETDEEFILQSRTSCGEKSKIESDCLSLSQPSATGISEAVPGMVQKHVRWSVASEQTYNIKNTGEKSCNIYGCCQLPSGEILLADFKNNRLKKIDARYQMIGICGLPGIPRDVCYIGNNEALVYLYLYRKLQFVDVEGMKLTRSVDIEIDCIGLSCHGSQLYVTDSDTIYTYSTVGIKQGVLYTCPDSADFRHIEMSDDGSKIYITCGNKLVTLDSSGNHLYTFTDPELTGAGGMCVDGKGHVLVCDYLSRSILQISSDGKHKLGTIAYKYQCKFICFDRRRSILTCAGSSDDVIVLQLK